MKELSNFEIEQVAGGDYVIINGEFVILDVSNPQPLLGQQNV